VTDPEKRDLINGILSYEEGIAMAGKVLLTVSRDEVERARLESEFRYQLERQSDLVDARREGLAEGELIGLERGRLEERRETARRLTAMGLSPDQIAQASGLATGELS
jgi:predicted transposase/invertase (TIGR01784 family)